MCHVCMCVQLSSVSLVCVCRQGSEEGCMRCAGNIQKYGKQSQQFFFSFSRFFFFFFLFIITIIGST